MGNEKLGADPILLSESGGRSESSHEVRIARSVVAVPGRAVTLLSVFLALMFLAVSFAQASFSSAAPGDPVTGESSYVFPERPHRPASAWDWDSLADESGMVDVIVIPNQVWTDKGQLKSSMSSFCDQFQITSMKGFRLALDGFVARVSLDTLHSIAESDAIPFSVYPDLPVNATLVDSVPQIGADQLHLMTDGSGHAVTGYGMVVAVIDTGVDYEHPDLGGGFGPGYKVIGGYDFVNDDSDPMDDNGHGTHVAGIVAANGGITGVAPDASILAYKALGSGGSGSMSDVILAIEAAMDPNGDGNTADHADVISMSLGGTGDADDPVCVAVQEAIDAGVVVVIAAGNSGPYLGTVGSPGVAPNAITVGAVDDSWTLADFSSRGTIPDLSIKPEICAPGVNIESTVPGGGYGSMSGTSMATPHVSGGAVLLLQLHPTWTPAQVKSAMVTAAYDMPESVWAAGAGGLWLPDAVDTSLFFDPSVVSYGSAGDSSKTTSARNLGSSVTVSASSADWYAMSADGISGTPVWSNESSISPASVTISSSGSQTYTLTVPDIPVSYPEGYYDGCCEFSFSSTTMKVPFGFAVLSSLSVHVLDMDGDEVYDPYGGVWVYTHPDAEVAMSSAEEDYAPPAAFLVPSGTYNVHAAGHHLTYTYPDPYLLSDQVTVGRGESLDVYLSMSFAYAMVIDLETEDGNPIYVKDFRMYARHVGASNVSFHLTGTDYDVVGSDIFSLPKSQVVYVSPTDAAVGIAVAGYSYTAMMWDFMERNWDHWFEYPDSTSTAFQVESSADLRYLMAWEFDGVDSSSDTTLGLESGKYSVYDMKYDIPGSIGAVWGNWGTHLSMGGDASFYIRRDTEASISPIFSGVNRRTIVQGVFSSPYSPGSLFEGFFEQQHYIPDYSQLVHANTISPIYLPDRNFLAPIEGVTDSGRVGSGPYYAAIWTENTNDTIALFQPLLRDQSGAKVGGMYYPHMDLKRDGMVTGYYQFAEFLARPDAVRFIPITQDGFYEAVIEYQPTPELCDEVYISLGFNIPGTDRDPPILQSLVMPQRFVPGEAVPLTITAEDTGSMLFATVMWRAGESDDWASLSMVTTDMHTFATTIPTSTSDGVIDLMVLLQDLSGNYLNYTAHNAAFAQMPVTFQLVPSETEIGLRNGDANLVLSGELVTESGDPLCDSACVPIELFVDGTKVGMLLDEYMTSTDHVHDGNIRFEWHFNPSELFSYVGETVQVDAVFDLGIYEPATASFDLTATSWSNLPPEISLISPSEMSLIDAGTVIDLEVYDSGGCTAEAFLDGVSLGSLADPWDVDTSSWADGVHMLLVVATDDLGDESSADFQFEVDSVAPSVSILSPEDGTHVPVNWTIDVSVSDLHLESVAYSADGGPEHSLASPYDISLVGWELGTHAVTVTATDSVGHESSDAVVFTIEAGSIVLYVVSPEDGSVVRSGVPINVSALGEGSITCCWSEDGATYETVSSWTIPTEGWSEGVHELLITAASDLGGYDALEFTIVIDDTPPEIVLAGPAEFSYVTPQDMILMSIVDDNFGSVSYVLWGATRISSWSDIYVSLYESPGDGYFTIDVTATDLAGNEAEREIVFAMDSEAPELEILGFESGDAILPGQVLDVEASDFFLDKVEWLWDGSAFLEIEDPYSIDTGAIASGWQLLQVKATDYSGKVSWLNTSLYVDVQAPSVSSDWGDTFAWGSSLDLVAIVMDDYAVDSAVLWYDVGNGSYSSVDMVWSDGMYRASLSTGILWDGITVYLEARDTVGHAVETVPITFSATGVPDDDDDGGSGDGDTATGSGLPYFTYVMAAAGAAAASIVALILISRFRRRQGPVKSAPIPATAARMTVARPAQPAVEPSRPQVQVKRPASPQTQMKSASGPTIVKGSQLRNEMRGR